MPEFIIEVTFTGGYSEHRCAADTRHARRIMAGLKGRYAGITLRVFRLTGTDDVTTDFVNGRVVRA